MLGQTLRAVAQSMAGSDDDISWRVGIFALERLRPDPEGWLPPNVLWADYFCWCGEKDVRPLPVASFLKKFDEAAASLGVRKLRTGNTIAYARIALKPAA
ncbi:hypothetical protein [Hyphomicrobium sp. 99]|uniref:hypothetical protein n=1 Tax=Hyphomicrobium sp. 99 TaxID=1163419 RepID=UPI0005F7FC53|nr:hypothetical protein [Hyphomicrobium sp. 99]